MGTATGEYEMRRLWIILVLVGVAACWTVVQLPWDGTEKTALQGKIDEHAPVQAALQTVIHAPPEKIWRLLTDVNAWPTWQPAIKKAEIAGPVGSGTSFAWKMGGTEIHSKLAVVVPEKELVWSGRALGAAAIHRWRLEPLKGSGTLVRMDESMDGLLMRAFYSSEDLKESDQAWLDALKTAAEKQ